jgi:hypothetical protein
VTRVHVVVVINENVGVRLAKVLDLFSRSRAKNLREKAATSREAQRLEKKAEKNKRVKKRQKEEKKIVPVRRTDEDGGFLLFFSSLGWKKKCEHSVRKVINPSLYIALKKH